MQILFLVLFKAQPRETGGKCDWSFSQQDLHQKVIVNPLILFANISVQSRGELVYLQLHWVKGGPGQVANPSQVHTELNNNFMLLVIL